MRYLTLVSLLVSIAAFSNPSHSAETLSAAESESSSTDTLPEGFTSLRDRRAKLLKEIPILEREVEDLQFRVRNVPLYSRDLERAQSDLAAAEAESPPNKGKIESIKDFIRRVEFDLKDAQSVTANVKPKEVELLVKTRELSEVEEKIGELLNPEVARQKFKFTMSLSFAALVSLVIIGFFIIAYTDENVRKTIFAGQAGIQFLTLFSLVIAIILFGITGILEGKELSALLGGISGYILGKVN